MRLRGYPGEWLVLALIALATLPLVSVVDDQDSSRLALAQSIVQRGSFDIDPYWRLTTDRAYAGGHWYSDKAPGVALLAVPVVAAVRAADALDHRGTGVPLWERPWILWLLRLWSGGVALLGLAFLLGRAAEGLVAGSGAAAAVVLAVGTIAGSLGPTLFGHLPDALALFAAFVLATRARRPRDYLAVGVLAGIGVLFEYPAALAALILVVYAAYRGGARATAAVCVGGIPAAVVLAAYDWIAFGAPWRLSYRYTENTFTPQQHRALYGVGLPTGHGVWTVLLDGRGLLVVSPVLALAAAGLVAHSRLGGAEALAAGAIALAFLATTSGYFLPDGGLSPGPRFAAAALPFLLLGLPEALERWRRPTLVLAAWSVGLALFDELTWSVSNALRFETWPATAWSLLGLPREAGAILLVAAGGAAALLATRGVLGRRRAVRAVG